METSKQGTQAAYFPIRVVSSQTGVNAITLRAWERRYGLLTPKRTAKGHRLYSKEDISLIKQVVALLERGIPISQAQAMLNESTEAVAPLQLSPGEQSSQWQHYRENIHQGVQTFDETLIHKSFEEVIQLFPIDITLRFLLIPIYNQLKENQTQSLGKAKLKFYSGFLQGHLASRLYSPLQQTPLPSQPTVIVANVSEQEEISQLLLAILLKQMGVRVLYFSGYLSCDDIKAVVQNQQCQGIIVQPPKAIETLLLQQISALAIEAGVPVFISNPDNEYGDSLNSYGLIQLTNDIQQAALTVRDLTNELKI